MCVFNCILVCISSGCCVILSVFVLHTVFYLCLWMCLCITCIHAHDLPVDLCTYRSVSAFRWCLSTCGGYCWRHIVVQEQTPSLPPTYTHTQRAHICMYGRLFACMYRWLSRHCFEHMSVWLHIYGYVFCKLCMCAAGCLCSRFSAYHPVHGIFITIAFIVTKLGKVQYLLYRSVILLRCQATLDSSNGNGVASWADCPLLWLRSY